MGWTYRLGVMVLFLDVFRMSYGRILHYVLPYIMYLYLGPLSCDIMWYHVLSCAIMCYLSRNHFFGRYLYGKRWGSFELLVLSMCSAADHDSHGTTGHDFEVFVSLNTICSSNVNHMIFGLALACDLLSCWYKGVSMALWASSDYHFSSFRRKLCSFPEILPKIAHDFCWWFQTQNWSRRIDSAAANSLMAFGGPVCDVRRSAEGPNVPGRFSAGVTLISELWRGSPEGTGSWRNSR